jgi:hypothetical protein
MTFDILTDARFNGAFSVFCFAHVTATLLIRLSKQSIKGELFIFSIIGAEPTSITSLCHFVVFATNAVAMLPSGLCFTSCSFYSL